MLKSCDSSVGCRFCGSGLWAVSAGNSICANILLQAVETALLLFLLILEAVDSVNL